MNGHPRPIANVRPEVGSSVARAQPSSVPILENPPTNEELPTDENDEPVGVIYMDQSTETVKITMPDGSSGVTTMNLLDMSAEVSLDLGDVTGLL